VTEVWSIIFTYQDREGQYVQREVFRSEEIAALKVSAEIRTRIERLGMKFYWSQVKKLDDAELQTLEDYVYEDVMVH